MPSNQSARTFIIAVIALGGIFVLEAAVFWTGPLLVFAAYLVLAAVASTLKVRLPGIPGTFSANCLITVLATARLSIGQLVFVSVVCAMVQTCWRSDKLPPPVKVLFNAGVFAIAGAAGGWTYAALVRLVPAIPQIASLTIASCLFFFINTGAVSVVVALIDGVSPLPVWAKWHVWTLPYYLVNVGLAFLIVVVVPNSVLVAIALIVPLLLGPFAVYQWFVRRLVRRAAPAGT